MLNFNYYNLKNPTIDPFYSLNKIPDYRERLKGVGITKKIFERPACTTSKEFYMADLEKSWPKNFD